jgi:hypothetical protein
MPDKFEEFRMGHLVRTASLWKRLVNTGASPTTKLDFDFSFLTSESKNAEKLCIALSSYKLSVEKKGLLRKQIIIMGQSGAITWTEEQLLKWVDYLIAIGNENGCEFTGCGSSFPRAFV